MPQPFSLAELKVRAQEVFELRDPRSPVEHPELLTGIVHEMDPAALTAFRRVAPL